MKLTRHCRKNTTGSIRSDTKAPEGVFPSTQTGKKLGVVLDIAAATSTGVDSTRHSGVDTDQAAAMCDARAGCCSQLLKKQIAGTRRRIADCYISQRPDELRPTASLFERKFGRFQFDYHLFFSCGSPPSRDRTTSHLRSHSLFLSTTEEIHSMLVQILHLTRTVKMLRLCENSTTITTTVHSCLSQNQQPSSASSKRVRSRDNLTLWVAALLRFYRPSLVQSKILHSPPPNYRRRMLKDKKEKKQNLYSVETPTK